MVDPSPFSSDVATLPIAANFQTIYTVSIGLPDDSVTALRPIHARIDYNRRRTPYVVAEVECALPTDAVLARLDPDVFDTRLLIRSGYRRITTGIQEVYNMARLRCTEATIDRTAQTITLKGESDETVVIQQAALTTYTWTTSDTYVSRVQQLINACFPGETPNFTVTADSDATLASAVTVNPGDDIWDVIVDLMDAGGFEVRHDGMGQWLLAPPVSTPDAPDANVDVGPEGGVGKLRLSASKADAYTDVLGRWVYSEAGVNKVTWARGSTGRTPRSTRVVTRNKKPVNATATMRRMMDRALRRGRVASIEATTALWLRPSDTVLCRVPSPHYQVRALVESVEFVLDTATMRIAGLAPLENAHAAITITPSTTYTP